MQLPFDLADVRMICLDGDKVRFVLPEGHVEIAIDSRGSLPRKAGSHQSATRPAKHNFFDDGIYGI
jgi:hypothetical protein